MDQKDKEDKDGKLISLYESGMKKVDLLRDKEEKFLKHMAEINRERERIKGKSDKLKILKLVLTVLIVLIGIYIMFIPDADKLEGKSIFMFKPPENLKLNLGQYTVINFFASWCDTCTEEIPELVQLQSSGNVSVIGVAVQDEKDKVENLAKIYNINYQIIHDPDGKFAKSLGIDAIPTTLILSGDSKIRKVIYGPASVQGIMKMIKKIESGGEK